MYRTRVCLQCPVVFEVYAHKNSTGNKLHCSERCSRRTANQRARGQMERGVNTLAPKSMPRPNLFHPFKPIGVRHG